jgi:exodeoxyribonuclease VII large subunit
VAQRQILLQQASRLQALSPLSVLGRGYAIVLDTNGQALTDSRQLKLGDDLSVRFHRGAASTRVIELEPPDWGDES